VALEEDRERGLIALRIALGQGRVRSQAQQPARDGEVGLWRGR
jgi:hypothetical protein